MYFYGDTPNEFKVVNNTSLLVVRDKENKKVKASFDFKEFTYPPDYAPKVKQFIYQDVLWAYLDLDVLYVSHAHWTHSASSKGFNGYITAISMKTKKILWRSQAKVSNAINFLVRDNCLITGYGYTREGAKLFALDKFTGKVINEVVLAAPRTGKKHIEYLYDDGKQINVHTFDNTSYKVTVK